MGRYWLYSLHHTSLDLTSFIHDNLYLLILSPNPPFLSSLLSPQVTTDLFPIPVSLFILFCCYCSHSFNFYIPHLSDFAQYLSFSVWLISLSIIPSLFIHVVAYDKNFVLFYGCVCGVDIYYIFFIHSSVEGHLNCFHILAIVNNLALNIAVHVSFWVSVFVLDIHSGVGLQGHMTVLLLVFWETSILFSPVAAPVYIPSSCVQGSLFHILANICCLCSFWW